MIEDVIVPCKNRFGPLEKQVVTLYLLLQRKSAQKELMRLHPWTRPTTTTCQEVIRVDIIVPRILKICVDGVWN